MRVSWVGKGRRPEPEVLEQQVKEMIEFFGGEEEMTRMLKASRKETVIPKPQAAKGRKPEPEVLEQQIKEMIEFFGGEEEMKRGNELFHQVVLRMDRDRAALTEQYPYKWVAVGKDGLLEVGDSLQEVNEAVKARGMKNSEYVLHYLDPDPPPIR